MEYSEIPTVYFAKKGRHNTEKVLELVGTRGRDLGIQTVVVATTGGSVGRAAAEKLSSFEVVVVTHSTGFREPGRQEVPDDVLAGIRDAGAHVLTTTHAFGGVGRAVRKKFDTWQTEELIAQTLKRFGEGVKVAVEVALMAADAGLVPVDREIISCGGTSHGLDTALVLVPSHAQTFFDIQIREIICKPRTP